MTRATEGLGSVAQAVKGTTQQLRANNQETAARIVEKTAEQIERFSNQLRQKDFGDIVGDAERLARRQPALFIGASFALGIIAARFLKSSPQSNRYPWSGRSSSEYGVRDYTPHNPTGAEYGSSRSTMSPDSSGQSYGGGAANPTPSRRDIGSERL